MFDSVVVDNLGRHLRDLRISVTDRCNFRCRYCMPRERFGEEHTFLPRRAYLSFDEIEKVMKQVPWDFKTPADKIFDFFRNPPVHDIEIEKQVLDPEGLRKLLLEEHGFSESRVGSTLKKLSAVSEKRKQSSLGSFLGG